MINAKTFTAIDFETAQGQRNSICQVGLVRIESGIVTNEINILVQPPNNYYWYQFTAIDGISAKDTLIIPRFDTIWKQIEPFIANQNVVAHNGFSFDFLALAKTLAHYGLSEPNYNIFCTLKMYKKNLASLCE